MKRGGHVAAVLCCYALLFAVFFSPVLLRGDLLAPGDGLIFWLPLFLRPRTWWTPLIFSGFPVAAEPTLQTYYPLSWLLAQLAAWNAFIVSAYVIGAAGTYAYVFTLTGSVRSAVVGGIVFGVSGFLLAHLGHASIIHGAAWIPAILWPLERLRRRREPVWIAVAALAVANIILGGHPQMWAYGLGLAITYAAVVGWSAPSGRCWLYTWSLFAFAAGIGLAAVQLVPAVELIGQTVRDKISFSEFVSFALPPRQLLQLLLPSLYGTPPGSPYAAPPFGGATITETAAYVGWLPLGLAAIALRSPADHVVARFWATLAVLALLLALGDATPLARLIYQLPVYGGFRCPARACVVMALAVAALAGMGLAVLEQGGETARRAGARGAAVLLILVAATGGAVFLLRGTLRSAAAAAGIPTLPLLPWHNPTIGIPLAFGIVGAAVIWRYGARPSRAHAVLLAALTLADLASFGWFLEWRFLAPGPSALEPPPALERYRGPLAATHGRLLPHDLFGPAETAPPNRNILWGIPSASGLTSVPLRRYVDLGWMTDDPRLAPAVLDMLAVRYLALRPDRRFGFTWGSGMRTLLRTRGAVGYAWTVPHQWATAIGIVAALGDSASLADGTPVARVDITTAGGEVLALPLRAGEHLSEWTYDNPRVTVRHRRATPFEEVWVAGRRGQWYLARIDLPQRSQVRAIRIASIATEAEIIVNRISLRDDETGVSYPLASRVADASRWRHVEDIGAVSVYENLRVMPRAWLVGRVLTLPPKVALRAIQQEKLPDGAPFDPGEVALVEDPIDFVATSIAPSDAVSVDRIEDTRMHLTARSASGAFLVVSDTYYPGWQAFVDDRPVPLYRANHVLRGLIVPAGEHAIDMVFRPRSALAGLAITLASLPLLAWGTWRCRRSLARPA